MEHTCIPFYREALYVIIDGWWGKWQSLVFFTMVGIQKGTNKIDGWWDVEKSAAPPPYSF